MHKRSMSTMAIALAMMAGIGGNAVHQEPQRRPKAPRRNYMPHQGKRECARRQGGQAWAEFKAQDRARRGLAV